MYQPVTKLVGPIRAVFSDLDGTMASQGALTLEVYDALYRLRSAGVPVVAVTGRPAGWGHALVHLCPFAAVIAENGGVSFVPTPTGIKIAYAVSRATLPRIREEMALALEEVQSQTPALRLSADSRYREVDLAIDWNEDVHASPNDAAEASALLRERGFSARRSSVHVNFGPDSFDKYTACKGLVPAVLGEGANGLEDCVFVGDSLNDVPAFAGFAKSVGVANVLDVWDDLESKPSYVTSKREGAGFCELAEHILALL